MRYYIGLGAVLAAATLILGGVQLVAWWGNVDVTIPIKELNQQIAPAALSCPDPYYPQDSEVECVIEGDLGRLPVSIRVEGSGVTFTAPAAAEEVIAEVTGRLQ